MRIIYYLCPLKARGLSVCYISQEAFCALSFFRNRQFHNLGRPSSHEMLLVLSRYIRFLCYGNHGIPVRAWEKTVYPKWALASLGKVDRSSFHASLLVKHLTCAAERGATTTERGSSVSHRQPHQGNISSSAQITQYRVVCAAVALSARQYLQDFQ